MIELTRNDAAAVFADAAHARDLLDVTMEDGRPLSEALVERLDALAAVDEGASDAAFEVRVGSHHIQLKKAIWKAAVTGTIAVASAADPTPLTKLAAAAKLIHYLVELKTFIQTLSPVERDVYDLVVADTERLRTSGSVLRSPYPSVEDLTASLRAQDREIAGNLKDVLDSLVRKGGLSVVFESDSATRYRRVI